MDYPDERYKRDPQFAQLVDRLYMMIKEAQFSPTEIREAAMLVQIKWEQFNPRPIMVSEKLERQMAIFKNANLKEKV